MVGIVASDAGGMIPPRVLLDLSWDIDTDVTIVRRDPDGVARPVRGCEPLSLPTDTVTWSGADFEAPLNVNLVYEASSASGTRRVSTDVQCSASAFYPNDQGWFTSRGAVWLRHLTIPALSMPVDLANAESPVFTQTRTVVAVLNRAAPIVLTDARRKASTTTLDIRTWSLEEAARLRELLADNSVLLLDVPCTERWGITHWWVAVGDVTEERLVQEWAEYEGRVFHLPVEIVERPPGGVVYPDCSFWAVARGVASYYQWEQLYADYAQLGACYLPDPDPGPDPDPDTTVLDESDTTNFGARGNATTTPGPSRSVDANNTTTYPAGMAFPTMVGQFTDTFYAGMTYTIPAQINYVTPDEPASLWSEIRYTAGSSATASTGTVIDASTPVSVSPAGYKNLFPHEGAGYTTWTPPASGIYTLTLNVCGDIGTWHSWTDVGYTQVTFSTTVYDAPTTTYTGDDVIAMRVYPSLVAGQDYLITASQTLAAGFTDLTTVELLLAESAVDDDTLRSSTLLGASNFFPGGGVATATPAGHYSASVTGTYEVGIRVYADGMFTDGTDVSHARTITVRSV